MKQKQQLTLSSKLPADVRAAGLPPAIQFDFHIYHPELFPKRFVIKMDGHDSSFPEYNTLCNVASAVTNNRLDIYLNSLSKEVSQVSDHIIDEGKYSNNLQRIIGTVNENNFSELMRSVIDFFEERAKSNITIYEPLYIHSLLHKRLKKRLSKSKSSRSVKRSLKHLESSIDRFSLADSIVLSRYPKWMSALFNIVDFEFQLNRHIHRDDINEYFFDFRITKDYIDNEMDSLISASDYVKKRYASEDKCLDLIYMKKCGGYVKCGKHGCDGEYTYQLSGRRSFSCNQEGCRDQYSPCVGTYFEYRKDKLSNLLYKVAKSRISEVLLHDVEEHELYIKRNKSSVGRRLWNDVKDTTLRDNKKSIERWHNPKMGKLPKTGLSCFYSENDSVINLSTFPLPKGTDDFKLCVDLSKINTSL